MNVAAHVQIAPDAHRKPSGSEGYVVPSVPTDLPEPVRLALVQILVKGRPFAPVCRAYSLGTTIMAAALVERLRELRSVEEWQVILGAGLRLLFAVLLIQIGLQAQMPPVSGCAVGDVAISAEDGTLFRCSEAGEWRVVKATVIRRAGDGGGPCVEAGELVMGHDNVLRYCDGATLAWIEAKGARPWWLVMAAMALGLIVGWPQIRQFADWAAAKLLQGSKPGPTAPATWEGD